MSSCDDRALDLSALDLSDRAIYRHQPVHVSGAPSSTIIRGNYKLTLHYSTPDSKKYKGYGWYEMYDLSSDIAEGTNMVKELDLSKPNPASRLKGERLQTTFLKLARELNQWLCDTKAPLPFKAGTKEPVALPAL